MKVTNIATILFVVLGTVESITAAALKDSNSDTKNQLQLRGRVLKKEGNGNTDNNGINGDFQDKSASENTPGEGAGEGEGAENGQGNGVDSEDDGGGGGGGGGGTQPERTL